MEVLAQEATPRCIVRVNDFLNKGFAVAIGISIAVVLIVTAELALRGLRPDWANTPGNNDVVQLHSYSETYGWVPRRNATGVLLGKPVSINKLGYRGKPYSYSATTGKKRVVIEGHFLWIWCRRW
jgi:hypothetical protein